MDAVGLGGGLVSPVTLGQEGRQTPRTSSKGSLHSESLDSSSWRQKKVVAGGGSLLFVSLGSYLAGSSKLGLCFASLSTAPIIASIPAWSLFLFFGLSLACAAVLLWVSAGPLPSSPRGSVGSPPCSPAATETRSTVSSNEFKTSGGSGGSIADSVSPGDAQRICERLNQRIGRLDQGTPLADQAPGTYAAVLGIVAHTEWLKLTSHLFQRLLDNAVSSSAQSTDGASEGSDSGESTSAMSVPCHTFSAVRKPDSHSDMAGLLRGRLSEDVLVEEDEGRLQSIFELCADSFCDAVVGSNRFETKEETLALKQRIIACLQRDFASLRSRYGNSVFQSEFVKLFCSVFPGAAAIKSLAECPNQKDLSLCSYAGAVAKAGDSLSALSSEASRRAGGVSFDDFGSGGSVDVGDCYNLIMTYGGDCVVEGHELASEYAYAVHDRYKFPGMNFVRNGGSFLEGRSTFKHLNERTFEAFRDPTLAFYRAYSKIISSSDPSRREALIERVEKIFSEMSEKVADGVASDEASRSFGEPLAADFNDLLRQRVEWLGVSREQLRDILRAWGDILAVGLEKCPSFERVCHLFPGGVGAMSPGDALQVLQEHKIAMQDFDSRVGALNTGNWQGFLNRKEVLSPNFVYSELANVEFLSLLEDAGDAFFLLNRIGQIPSYPA